jgi:hypothetical protein
VSDVSYTVSARSLTLAGGGTAGVVHFALIADSVAPSATVLAAAASELAAWTATTFP